MPTKNRTRYSRELQDSTIHFAALRPDSRFMERATVVVGLLALSVSVVGVLFLVGSPS